MYAARRIMIIALVATLPACSTAGVSQRVTPVGHGVTTALTNRDTTRFSLTIDAWRSATYYLGAGNTLTLPAGSICDPAKSTYGAGEWNKPCPAARSAVAVHVKAWLDEQGHPRVDFTPHLRFVPSVLPTGWVTLTLLDYAASLDPQYRVLYCETETAGCVDDAKQDPTLVTVRDSLTGQVMRRIKHASGYGGGH